MTVRISGYPAPTRGATVNGVKAIAFDAYGTLINASDGEFVTTMAEICALQGFEADANDLWKRFLKAAYDLRAENHHEPIFKRYDEAWSQQFERVFKALRLTADPQAAAVYMKTKLATAPAFEETHEAVEALRPHYRLAVLSNADDDFLLDCLAHNGLEFDPVITSEQAQALKPDPAIFGHLADRLGLAAEEILYVGDNPIPDILGAKQAGLKMAWINRSGRRRPRKVPPPDFRLGSLTELVRVLAP